MNARCTEIDAWATLPHSCLADHGLDCLLQPVGPRSRAEKFATLTRVKDTAHGTNAGWHSGCRCAQCSRAHADDQRARGRAWAQKRLPAELRQQLLDAIYSGQPFRTALRDLGLTSNQVWGLTKNRPRMVREAGGRVDSNPPGRPPELAIELPSVVVGRGLGSRDFLRNDR